MTSSLISTRRSPLLRRTTLVATLAALAPLTACVFDSPYWGQTFDTTTKPIPMQTWAVDKTRVVKIECSKAYHGGLYPFGGPEQWTLVTNIMPSANASYDTLGGTIYSAGVQMTLPASCWNADNAYTPALYVTALRATQLTSNGSTTVYRVFDLAGLECLGRENGKGGSWFSWLSKSCALTYSNSTTALPWVKIIAKAQGAAAVASVATAEPNTARLAEAQQQRAAQAVITEDAVQRTFQAEAIDAAWASAREARLRVAYDTAHPEGTRLLEAACRSSLCRVEVTHVNAEAQERFVVALAPAGLFTNDGTRGMAVHKADGTGVRSVYFMAREGRELTTGTERATDR